MVWSEAKNVKKANHQNKWTYKAEFQAIKFEVLCKYILGLLRNHRCRSGGIQRGVRQILRTGLFSCPWKNALLSLVLFVWQRHTLTVADTLCSNCHCWPGIFLICDHFSAFFCFFFFFFSLTLPQNWIEIKHSLKNFVLCSDGFLMFVAWILVHIWAHC